MSVVVIAVVIAIVIVVAVVVVLVLLFGCCVCYIFFCVGSFAVSVKLTAKRCFGVQPA